jgi:hypothetical protein
MLISNIQPKDFAMFQLAFHLPYYVWRKSEKACEDHRRDANARRLRLSQDVSFLDWESSESSFLYEAQISCLVAGTDESRWVAYCFVDNYFDAAEEGKETVLSYHEDTEDDDGMHADPLTFGTYSADNPKWNPREYFLAILRVRLQQVKCEWQQVVAKVQQSIRENVSFLLSWPRCGRFERSLLALVDKNQGIVVLKWKQLRITQHSTYL